MQTRAMSFLFVLIVASLNVGCGGGTTDYSKLPPITPPADPTKDPAMQAASEGAPTGGKPTLGTGGAPPP